MKKLILIASITWSQAQAAYLECTSAVIEAGTIVYVPRILPSPTLQYSTQQHWNVPCLYSHLEEDRTTLLDEFTNFSTEWHGDALGYTNSSGTKYTVCHSYISISLRVPEVVNEHAYYLEPDTQIVLLSPSGATQNVYKADAPRSASIWRTVKNGAIHDGRVYFATSAIVPASGASLQVSTTNRYTGQTYSASQPIPTRPMLRGQWEMPDHIDLGSVAPGEVSEPYVIPAPVGGPDLTLSAPTGQGGEGVIITRGEGGFAGIIQTGSSEASRTVRMYAAPDASPGRYEWSVMATLNCP